MKLFFFPTQKQEMDWLQQQLAHKPTLLIKRFVNTGRTGIKQTTNYRRWEHNADRAKMSPWTDENGETQRYSRFGWDDGFKASGVNADYFYLTAVKDKACCVLSLCFPPPHRTLSTDAIWGKTRDSQREERLVPVAVLTTCALALIQNKVSRQATPAHIFIDTNLSFVLFIYLDEPHQKLRLSVARFNRKFDKWLFWKLG